MRSFLFPAFLGGALALSGCVDTFGQTATVDQASSFAATSSQSHFRAGLTCLDGLMAKSSLPTTDVVVGAMPDATGEIRVALRDMTMNAISRANVRSGAFRVIDMETVPSMGVTGTTLPGTDRNGIKLSVNSLHVTGSIVSFSRSILNSSTSIGIGGSDSSGGIAAVGDLSTITTGMRVSRFGTREVLYNEQHQLAFAKRERGLDLFGTVNGLTPFATLDFERNASPAAAVQALVDLHVIELLGKASGVAYWTCLTGTASQPQADQKIANDWRNLSKTEQSAEVTRLLNKLGYAGADAIARFQVDRGMVATGEAVFEVYLAARRQLGGSAGPVGEGAPILTLKTVPIATTVRLEIGLSRSAHVYCWHQDKDGSLSRIFPNPWQQEPYLSAASTHFVPNTVAEKQIRIHGSGLSFMCAGFTENPDDDLPSKLRSDPFEDMRGPGLRSLTDLEKMLTRTFGAGVSVQRVSGP